MNNGICAFYRVILEVSGIEYNPRFSSLVRLISSKALDSAASNNALINLLKWLCIVFLACAASPDFNA
jgi:hypothetical protein